MIKAMISSLRSDLSAAKTDNFAEIEDNGRYVCGAHFFVTGFVGNKEDVGLE